MTDAQIALLITTLVAGFGTIGAAIRFIGGRIVKSNDASTAALIANTASNAVLMVKIDGLIASNAALAAKLDSIGDWVEEHTPPPQDLPEARAISRTKTPARGTEYHHRPTTKGGDR